MKFVIILVVACCATMCYTQNISPSFVQLGDGNTGFQQRPSRGRSQSRDATVFLVPLSREDILRAAQEDGTNRPRFQVDLSDPIATFDVDLRDDDEPIFANPSRPSRRFRPSRRQSGLRPIFGNEGAIPFGGQSGSLQPSLSSLFGNGGDFQF